MGKGIDGSKFRFAYYKTDYNARCYYSNGKWGEIEISDSEFIPIHMAATCLQYGQEAFEGVKAYRGKDDSIRVFRLEKNAERLQSSCRGLMMPEVPTELFCDVAHQVVKLNERWIPAYGSGAALYLRPLVLGMSPQVGVHYAKEYLFVMFATPVGPYFINGFATNDMMIIRDYDRAAPLGTGQFKVGANYAGSLRANEVARNMGYACEIYLDPKEKKYLDECGGANVFGIKGDTYVTPLSDTILPSITNMSLQVVARDIGLKVECRPILVEELADFDEFCACGTGAIVSPVGKVFDPGTGVTYQFSKDGKPGKWSKALYDRLLAIQFGEIADSYDWVKVYDDL